jgi:predicted amidohydrolase YtcJ
MHLDAIFTGGHFITVDDSRPTASRVGVLGGLVAGLDDDLDGCTAEVVHDLQGHTVVPGMIDAHHHLSANGQALLRLDLSPAQARTVADIARLVREWAQTLPPGKWVLGEGYDDTKLDRWPTRHDLDAAVPDRPVWIGHTSHHQGVLNTAAIRALGYDHPRDLPDVPSGFVGRDADGLPTGYLAERALDLVFAHLRPEPFEPFLEAIRAGSDAALAMGLTGAVEAGISGRLVGNGPDDLHVFQTAVDQGLLRVRMTVMPEIGALHRVDRLEGLRLDLGLRSGLGDDRLRIGAVKVFSDGALTAHTAAMCEPYEGMDTSGILYEDPEALHETIRAAHLAGWQVATHAIGDRAIETVLDGYERALKESPRRSTRHRIEHAGAATDADIARMARLGVVPVPQWRFLTAFGDMYEKAIGRERTERMYRARSYLNAGIELPGSSDCPVVSGSPIKGIHSLVNRTLPDGSTIAPQERVTVHEALRAYTYGSAHADHQEHRKGTISRGKLADFVVLSEDLYAVSPERIEHVEVVSTIVGGAVEHDTGLLEAPIRKAPP